MKVTLKSLQQKYATYGYTFVKSGSNYVEILFDGVRVRTVCGQAYVKMLDAEMKGCYWMTIGEACELPTLEVPEEIGVEAEKRFQASLDSPAKECNTEKVKTEEPQMQPTEISFFQDVIAMNSRVSDDDLNDFEAKLQEELTEESEAVEEAKPKKVQMLPLEVREMTSEMKQLLERQPELTVDRYSKADGSTRFVVYYYDWERLGSLELRDRKWVVCRLATTFGMKTAIETSHSTAGEAIAFLMGNKLLF